VTPSLHIASHSEIGLVRKNNQDSGYASGNLLVVADGMGGAAAGDLASAVAVDTIRKIDVPTSGEHMLEVLAQALRDANSRIAELVDADYTLEGMGTTVTGALFDGSQLGLAHIGDSRAYLLHESRLERLTHDHSWVQSLVDDGKITEEEAAVHPHRSLLLKVLNGQPANDPDLTMVKVEVGDRFLLCSDGLCGLVDDDVIEQAMRLPKIEDALRQLVDEALAEGGIDNITVIVAEVVESADAPGSAVLGAADELSIPALPGRADALSPQAVDAQPTPGGAADAEETVSLTRSRVSTSTPGVDALPGGAATAGGAAATAAGDGPAAEHEDEERYSPQPPHKRRLGRPLATLLVLVLIVGAGVGSAYAWTRTQFYVGAAGDQVAIFQGLSDGIPGVALSKVYEVQPLPVSSLPPYYQQRVRANIDVMGLAAARGTVTQLSDAAKRCAVVAGRPTSTSPMNPAAPRNVTPDSNVTASSNALTSSPSRSSAAPPPSVLPATPRTSPRTSAPVGADASPRPDASTSALPEAQC
jgi:serine/threonine protein phosphatase PrpC